VVAAAVATHVASARLHSQGKATSLAQLEALARADSNDPVAHYNLAAALVKTRHYGEAERSLREAVRIDPQYAPALLLLA
jgi:cytochrome c-type biogenesis protein CcmH/NrfG